MARVNWKNIEEKIPEDGSFVWVVLPHWKMRKPGSFIIAGGLVQFGHDGSYIINTCDDDGRGCNCFYPLGSTSSEEVFEYWCYDYELVLPEEYERS